MKAATPVRAVPWRNRRRSMPAERARGSVMVVGTPRVDVGLSRRLRRRSGLQGWFRVGRMIGRTVAAVPTRRLRLHDEAVIGGPGHEDRFTGSPELGARGALDVLLVHGQRAPAGGDDLVLG